MVVVAVGRIPVIVIPSSLKMQNSDTERILWTQALRVELLLLQVLLPLSSVYQVFLELSPAQPAGISLEPLSEFADVSVPDKFSG